MNVEQRRIQCWDIDSGYAAAHEKHQAEFLRSRFGLQVAGFQEVRVFRVAPDHFLFARTLAKMLDYETYITAENVETFLGTNSRWTWDLKTLFEEIFSSTLSLLHQYFQSEFAPCFCSMLKQGPMGKEIDDSYRWHRDSGPTSHLKLVIYLNDDHDGAAAVMSRKDSRKFIDAGYGEEERLFHLDDFAVEHGISYKPYKVQPKAGSGLIFEPTNVLHKGVYPTFGERRVFQIGIIPWGKPWESFYDEHWAKGYTNSNGFPKYDTCSRNMKK